MGIKHRADSAFRKFRVISKLCLDGQLSASKWPTFHTRAVATIKMTRENLYNDLAEATEKLLGMARDHSWNTISNNCLYIISEIEDSNGKNFFEQRKIRKKVNHNKEPKPLQMLITDLECIYENLYDVNLYVFQSTSRQTVVEIQFYPKSSLNKDYLEKVKDNDPMLHCKVAIPPYSNDDKSKFDINWELGGLRHEWKMYWWRKRTKRELNKRKTVTSNS